MQGAGPFKVLANEVAGRGWPVPEVDLLLADRIVAAKVRAVKKCGHRGARAGFSFTGGRLFAGAVAAGKFRVGFDTAIYQVQAFVFFLFADPDAQHRFENGPDNQAGNKYPGKDRYQAK